MGKETRAAVLKALAEIRRAQVKVRLLGERMRGLDEESALRLLALWELLERLALRLETISVLGVASPDLMRGPLALMIAMEALKAYAPPDVRYMLSTIERSVETIYSGLPEPRLAAEELREEAEQIVREALEAARKRAKA
ncbi:MAG: hypothetical protein N3F67_03685 [Acidilobaceae archaeon]|nr:hypothetical protein [Acidilobaceae archaeon]